MSTTNHNSLPIMGKTQSPYPSNETGKTIKQTDKFRLYIVRGHAFVTSKVGGRPKTVNVRRKGGDFNYLRNLSDGEFNASACLEFGCGLYQ